MTAARDTHSGTGHDAPSRCPTCGGPLPDAPLCGRDGTVAAPFVIGERYRVEETLGAGGMAFVLGARHLVLGKSVAVKVLRPELAGADHAARFLREARLASQLQHENIVGISDYGEDAALGIHFLVMDRLRGVSLAQTLAAEGPLPWSWAVPILAQLARALGCAHASGIVHRDLTPKNVMLDESSGRRDVVKLCDFGVSRTIEGDDRVTITGQFIGTPVYMPPEQIRGDADQGAAVDVYALGTIAYEMLTGELPYAAPTAVAVIAAKLRGRRIDIRADHPGLALPEELNELIARCMAPDPAERPSAAAVEAVLTRMSLRGAPPVHRSMVRPLDAPREEGAPTTDLIGARVGSYEVVELLGTGGMGSVYKAVHPSIGTEVAIKVILPEVAGSEETVKRFAREARASSAIGSPYIPRYFDFGTLPDGRAYAIMEFFEGETVAERLERSGPMSLKDTRRILDRVTQAMAEAHFAGIIHRDLKPDNLFLVWDKQGNETVRVLDFGIAQAANRPDARLTVAGTFVGTPAYCAPEQAFGDAVGPEADVYALGGTLFEMLTGACPFEGDFSEIFAAKGQGQVPSARRFDPSLPREVDETIARAMALLAANRFSTMDELRASILAWPEDSEGAAESVKPPLPRRRALPFVAGGALMLLAFIGAGAYLWPDDSPPAAPAPAAAVEPAVEPAIEPTIAPAIEPARSSEPLVIPPAPPTPPAEPAAPEPAVVTARPSRERTQPPAQTRSRRSRTERRPLAGRPERSSGRPRPIVADPFQE